MCNVPPLARPLRPPILDIPPLARPLRPPSKPEASSSSIAYNSYSSFSGISTSIVVITSPYGSTKDINANECG